MRHFKVPRTERVYGYPIKVYDNGGKTWDRYIVLYMHPINFQNEMRKNGYGYDCLGMSENPYHPQGFGCHDECIQPGAHLGKKIRYKNLPKRCKEAVRSDIREYKKYLKKVGKKCLTGQEK